jgi:hypothetical protein
MVWLPSSSLAESQSTPVGPTTDYQEVKGHYAITFSRDFDNTPEDNQLVQDDDNRNAEHGSGHLRLSLSPSSDIDAICIW